MDAEVDAVMDDTPETQARTELLESLNIQFPSDEDVADEELTIYMTMMDKANLLIDECLRLKKELNRSNEKVRKMGAGFASIAEEECGDVVFKLKGDTTRAHSSVVCAWSDPLFATLQSGMREERQKCVEITTEQPVHVRKMLKYFYTSSADLEASTIFPLLRLSCLYAVDILRDECCEYLLKNIDAGNCMETLSMADLHQFEEVPIWDDLKIDAKLFYIAHLPEIVKINSSPFRDMSIPRIIEYLEYITEDLKIKYDDEDEEAERKSDQETASSLSTAVVNWARDIWSPVHTFPHVIMHINSEIAVYKIQLFVKISGNTLSVFIKKTSNVYDLKVELEKSSGIPIIVQRLMFEGKYIADTDTLTECGIMPDCTVHLSVTQFPTKKKPPPAPKKDPEPREDFELLGELRDLCITILAYDFAAQSCTSAFLDLDFETLMSVMQQECINDCDENILLTAACEWIHANVYRNTTKIIDKLTSSGCDALTQLKETLTLTRKGIRS